MTSKGDYGDVRSTRVGHDFFACFLYLYIWEGKEKHAERWGSIAGDGRGSEGDVMTP